MITEVICSLFHRKHHTTYRYPNPAWSPKYSGVYPEMKLAYKCEKCGLRWEYCFSGALGSAGEGMGKAYIEHTEEVKE